MPAVELRPRLGTEIVDAAFQLYRRHFLELLSLNALVFAPFVLINLLVTASQPATPGGGAITMTATMIVGFVFSSLAQAAMVAAVSNSYLHGAPEVAGALRRAFSRSGAILLATLAIWTIVGLAFVGTTMILFIPTTIVVAVLDEGAAGIMLVLAMLPVFTAGVAAGLYFFCRYFAVPAAVVLEGLGVRRGLRRSRELSDGFKWKIAGTLALPTLLFALLQFALLSTLQLTLGAAPVLVTLLEQAASLVAMPILAIIAVLLYYDVRIRKEGFDIEMLAAELDGVEPRADTPSPTRSI